MRTEEAVFSGGRPVEGYGPGFFRIGGALVEGPIALGPGGAQGWSPDDAAALIALAGTAADLVVLGAGAERVEPAPDFLAALEAAGLGVELMATPAACRTYNVLLSQSRAVIAALIPV